jgi:hypothetical protein
MTYLEGSNLKSIYISQLLGCLPLGQNTLEIST